MALIECKSCGNKISEFATACPKCGTPKIDESLPEKKVESLMEVATEKIIIPVTTEEKIIHKAEFKEELTEQKEEPKKKKKTAWIIVISLIAIAILFLVLYLSGAFDRNSESNTNDNSIDRNNSQNNYESNSENESDREDELSDDDEEDYEPEDEEYYEESEEENGITAQDVENSLSDYVRVTFDYKQKLITGVHKIQVVVQNNSSYEMESVRVEVQYQRINNKVFDREDLYFYSVAPYSSMTLYAPDKSEGSFVKCVLIDGEVSK